MVGAFESCFQCTERTETCHATCEKYKKDKADYDAYMDKKRRSKDSIYRDYARSRSAKIDKAVRKKYANK